jgi:hypothetical protein
MYNLADRNGPKLFTLVTEPSSHDRQVQVVSLPECFGSVTELTFNNNKSSLLVKGKESVELTVADVSAFVILEPDARDV